MHNISQLLKSIKYIEELLIETWGSIASTCTSIEYALDLMTEGEMGDIPRVLANALKDAKDACGLIKAVLGVPPLQETEFQDGERFLLTTLPLDEE